MFKSQKAVLVILLNFTVLSFFSAFSSNTFASSSESFFIELDKYNERNSQLHEYLENVLLGNLDEPAKSYLTILKGCEIYLNLLYSQRLAIKNGYDLYESEDFRENIETMRDGLKIVGANESNCSTIIGSRALDVIINNS